MIGILPVITIGVLVVLFCVLFAAERLSPLRRARLGWGSGLLRRLLLNLGVSALAFATAVLVVTPAANAALGWSAEQPFGLMRMVSLPAWLAAGVTFLLMDLSFYYWHVANHRIPLLWRFHNVHHTDPDLDASTAFRFHFGEIGMSAGFRVVQVVLIGVPVGVYAVYELAFQANTLFHHSNIRMPIVVERVLNRLLVTPRMHGIHHSQVRRENRSNFGVVFPWWDWVHRSLRLNVPQEKVSIGIPAYMRPEDNRLGFLMTLPFRRQREYWRGGDGETVERDPAELAPDARRLGE